MRSRGRPESLRLDIPESMSGVGPGGVSGELPVKRRKWRNKVAWIVALAVLLGVLVWVGGGGLDLDLSSDADVAHPRLHAAGGREKQHSPGASDPAAAPASQAGGSFDGAIGVVLKKMAMSKGLDEAEVEEARLAATNAVREALRAPGGLPPPAPDAVFSEACSLRVEGLPLYHDKGQRCCKVTPQMLPPNQQLQLLQHQKQQQQQQGLGDGGTAAAGSLAAGGDGGAAAPQARRRALEEGLEAGEEGREEPVPGTGGALPGVLRTQRTGAVGGQEVACFPSFIIAGTQKSGTTALTGILEQHPQVMMAGRKELHFFDTKTPNQRAAEMYAGNFARFNASQAMEHRAPFVVGEATPFYLASRNACMHMRKLVPDIRLIVLVREPVKRAYSEHQMKVRRVEEQDQVLQLLPVYANQIYDCAVKALPSWDAESISKREEELLALPQALSAEIGECAGDIGQHGKWMDIMIPFIRRLKLSKSQGAGGNPRNYAEALEVFREDMTRCFPLKAVAEDLEEIFAGGAWKRGWSKRSTAMDRPGPPGAPKMPPRPRAGGAAGRPGAGGKPPTALPPGWGEKGQQHRNLKLYREHGWTADDLYLDGDLDIGDYYWNTTAAAVASEGDDDDVFGLTAGFERGRNRDHGRTSAVAAAAAGAAAGSAATYAADWWGSDLEERAAADYAYGSALGDPAMEEDALFAGGRGLGYDYGGADGEGDVGPASRGLASKQGAVFPDVPWAEVWGEWGKEGERTYDETCYQRRERVVPAGQVMGAEMKKLRTCFGDALGFLGGLDALAEANSVAAAKALDEKISRCFAVTPGISDQYIYRSLYGVQAYHCLKHMPRDQVMFIESDELRDKPEEIMPKIHQHIGVPDYEYPSFDQGTIMAELEKKYPDFEKRTGWRLDSEYTEDIPEALAKEIRDFTAPHMKMFARLTGQSFGDWAVNDRSDKEAMAGGNERPNELFEEEFHKETTRLAAAKKSVAFGGDKAAADANSNSQTGPNGAAAPTSRGEGASSAAAAATAAAAPPP